MDGLTLPIRGRPTNDGLPWTKDQLILAFELYCRIPFQKTKASNPQVKELAMLVSRTPASVARKLGNFGAFDPQLARQNISGLAHGSKLDKEIWEEFHRDWSSLIIQAYELRQSLGQQVTVIPELTPPSGHSERMAIMKQRLHQSFFRDAVLSSYGNRCCVTGLSIIECLVAGHIIPWSIDSLRRADPTNGLCMSATFDRLFDVGLFTIHDDFTFRVSNSLRNCTDVSVLKLIAGYHGQSMIRPIRFGPDVMCLRWHREHIFQGSGEINSIQIGAEK